jgi:superfamily II DNA or RNA helicase
VVAWTPRPGQAAALEQMREHARAGRRRLIVASRTGSGKTHLACWRIAAQLAAGLRVVVIVHRREILRQWQATLAEHGGDVSAVTWRTHQTRQPMPDLDARSVVWVDEAHLFHAAIKRSQVAAPAAWWVLLTATPCRLSGEPMGDVADVVIDVQTVAELEAEGSLVPAVVYGAASPELHNVPRRAGEYQAGPLELAYRAPSLVADVVTTWERLSVAEAGEPQTPRGRIRSLAFCAGIEQSRATVARLTDAGHRWAHVDGSTPRAERDAAWTALADGDLDGVSSVQLAIEGIDVRTVGLVVWARATMSLPVWLQGCGRAARAAPGKRRYIVQDHGGNAWEHGHPAAPRVWTLDGRQPAPPTDALRSCRECLAIYDPTEADAGCCPRCGAGPEVQVRRPPRVVAAELRPLTAAELARGRAEVSRQTPPRPPPAWLPERLHARWDANERKRQREGYALPVAGEGGWSEARARYAMR